MRERERGRARENKDANKSLCVFTYGTSNRPSTPMKLVMGNCYALEAEAGKEANYNTQVAKG